MVYKVIMATVTSGLTGKVEPVIVDKIQVLRKLAMQSSTDQFEKIPSLKLMCTCIFRRQGVRKGGISPSPPKICIQVHVVEFFTFLISPLYFKILYVLVHTCATCTCILGVNVCSHFAAW